MTVVANLQRHIAVTNLQCMDAVQWKLHTNDCSERKLMKCGMYISGLQNVTPNTDVHVYVSKEELE